MKTPNLHLLAVIILPAAVLLSQCAPTSDTPPRTPAVSSAVNQHWVKVSSNPPTYYPRGVAADAPTDCHSGEWVLTEDAQDTRFFIPLHGLTSERHKRLLYEALAAQSPVKRHRVAREEAGRLVGTGIGAVLVAPFLR